MDKISVREFLRIPGVCTGIGQSQRETYDAELERRKKLMEKRLSATKIRGLTCVELMVFAEKPTLLFYVNMDGIQLMVASTATDLVPMRVTTTENTMHAKDEISNETLKVTFDAELRRVYEGFLDQVGLDELPSE